MTFRLLGMVEENYPSIDGELALAGVDPLELSLDRLLNLAYWWATRHATDQADITRFDGRLWRPPPGQAPKGGPWTAEAETEAFGELAAQVYGRPDTANVAGKRGKQPETRQNRTKPPR